MFTMQATKLPNDIFVRLVAPGESRRFAFTGIIRREGETVGVTLYQEATVPDCMMSRLNSIQTRFKAIQNQTTMSTPSHLKFERPNRCSSSISSRRQTTAPNVPLVDEDYTISVRVDNLGLSNAIALEVDLEYFVQMLVSNQLIPKRLDLFPGQPLKPVQRPSRLPTEAKR